MSVKSPIQVHTSFREPGRVRIEDDNREGYQESAGSGVAHRLDTCASQTPRSSSKPQAMLAEDMPIDSRLAFFVTLAAKI